MKTAWNSISGLVQGDISYAFRTSALSNSTVDFAMVAYSEKWTKFDISFEFRAKREETWRKDAFLILSNANKIDGNKVIGLDASKYGAINLIRWDFAKNAITYGENIEVKINILPRVKHFSSSTLCSISSHVYGSQLSDIDRITTEVIILNLNNDGNYICSNFEKNAIIIRENPNGPNLLGKSSFNNISHAIQMPNRSYLVADYGAGQILELDENLVSITKTLSVTYPVFFEYNEKDETVLVTRKNANSVEEYTWRDDGYGELIWQSSISLSNPESASYKTNDYDQIVVADSNNNRVVLIDRVSNATNYISSFHFYEEQSSDVEILNFYKPFRVFWSEDKVYIIEKEGKTLEFELECAGIGVGMAGIDLCVG